VQVSPVWISARDVIRFPQRPLVTFYVLVLHALMRGMCFCRAYKKVATQLKLGHGDHDLG